MNAFILFLKWWYLEVPVKIFKLLKALANFILDFFSFSILLRTLWYPWKRIYFIKTGTLQDRIRAFQLNLISRLVGAVVRVFFIFVALFNEILLILLVPVVYLLWLILPILPILSLIYGLKIIF